MFIHLREKMFEIGDLWNFRGENMTIDLNEFTNLIVLDSPKGMISINRLKADTTCFYCEGKGHSYKNICNCVIVSSSIINNK